MNKNETNINTLEDEKKLSEIKSALANSALGGMQQEETIVSKGISGRPVARKRFSKAKPDPKAALAYAKLLQQTKDSPHRNKFVQITEDGRILVSTSKLAEIMRVSVKTIGVWDTKGAPKEKRGWWDIAEVIAWRDGQSDGSSAMADKLAADTRLKRSKAAMAELELQQKKGDLIPLAVVAERLAELFAEIRTSMLSIGDHIMAETYTQYPELAPQARRMIDGYIREALKEIADTGSFRFEQGRAAGKTAGRPRKRY